MVKQSLDVWSRPLAVSSSYSTYMVGMRGGVRNITASACLKVVLTEIRLGEAATPAQKAGTWLSHSKSEGSKVLNNMSP